jgi:hypothetical protein
MWKRKSSGKGGTYYKRGSNNLICDQSGFKIHLHEAKKTWDGYWVRKDFWEPRHPQDFVRGVRDKIKAEVTRPESEDVFVGANEVKRSDL